MFFMPLPWGCAWLCVVFGVCFVLVCLALICVGVGLGFGLVFWTVVLVGAVFGFGWFCLESLILAQDERWRRA